MSKETTTTLPPPVPAQASLLTDQLGERTLVLRETLEGRPYSDRLVSSEQVVGSLLLGLFDDRGVLASVGVVGAFPMAVRRELFAMDKVPDHLDNLLFEGDPASLALAEEHARSCGTVFANWASAGPDTA